MKINQKYIQQIIQNEDLNEPQVDSLNNQNMKTVKILLQKLNTQEIMDLTKNKKTKIEQRGKEKPKCKHKEHICTCSPEKRHKWKNTKIYLLHIQTTP